MNNTEVKDVALISTREKMLKLLRKEPLDDVVVAPIVESDYAASANGKEWCSEVDEIDDYLRAAEICGYDPVFDVQLDFARYNPSLQWETEEIERTEDRIRRRQTLKSPKGTLTMVTEEKKGLVPYCIESAIKDENDYRVLEWYFREMAKCSGGIRNDAGRIVKRVGDKGLVRLGAGNTFELSFIKYPDLLYSYVDHRDLHRNLMDVYLETQKVIIAVALKAGVDLIYASGVATELMSPQMFEETFLPTLKEECQFVQAHGGYFYYHSCGLTKKFIELGFYNEIAPDIFETLSAPPYGEIEGLQWAREQLSRDICTKGNLDTELLRTGSQEQITKEVQYIIDATWGYRHMVALADTILWGTPVENVKCMVQSARDYYRQKAL